MVGVGKKILVVVHFHRARKSDCLLTTVWQPEEAVGAIAAPATRAGHWVKNLPEQKRK